VCDFFTHRRVEPVSPRSHGGEKPALIRGDRPWRNPRVKLVGHGPVGDEDQRRRARRFLSQWCGLGRWIILLSLGTGLLSACVNTSSGPPPIPPLQARREEPRWQPPPSWRFVPHPARKPAPPTKPAAAKSLAAPPQAGELIGLDQPRAARVFGKATDKIVKPPATIWRYKTASCELDLFFYLDLRSGKMRTLHYAFKGDVGNTEKRQDCLRAIVADRAG
jgi:hypothetical protein